MRSWTPEDWRASGITTGTDGALATLNARLLEHRVSYQYESGRIVKIDNQLVHAQIVLPALQRLSDPSFAGANPLYTPPITNGTIEATPCPFCMRTVEFGKR